MPPLLHNIYHRMPPGLRTVAASTRGAYLQMLRYGRDTESIVAEAHEHETWSPEKLAAWQQARLSFVLRRAATRVPYYRAHWERRRRQGDRASFEYLENWPLLDKDTVHRNAAALIADDCNVRGMYRDQTSGSTGKPVSVWYSRLTMRRLYGYFEARVRRWHGVSIKDRWAIAGGQLVTPVSHDQPPFWTWNAAGRQLYLSSYHLKPAFVSAYAEAMRRYGVRYILGYTSALYSLARQLRRSGPVRMQVAYTNAEGLSEHQRQVISAGFDCPVVETYGMCELAAFASECPSGRMHLWPEFGYVEVSPTDGELACTGLLNADMPLIRYRVGDCGKGVSVGPPCACGRSLPLFGGVAGRMDDVLYSPDGRQIGRLDPLFKGELPLREAQIIQESLASVRVRYVPDGEFRQPHRDSIIRGLRDRMGNVEVVLEPVAEIPRAANGKFKAVVCLLPPDQISKLRSNHVNCVQ